MASEIPMADYSHTIDRWDDVTGEKLVEQIAAVGDYGLETYRAAVKRAPQPGAGHRAELGGLAGRSKLSCEPIELSD